jgi:hypothetical protein
MHCDYASGFYMSFDGIYCYGTVLHVIRRYIWRQLWSTSSWASAERAQWDYDYGSLFD